MNTPAKLKRHSLKGLSAEYVSRIPSGNYTCSLANPEYAARVAAIISEFVHLEQHMEKVLAMLLWTEDFESCGYVYRSIRSPRGRYDLLSDLLQKAPKNKQIGPEWDELINEFWAINQLRNNYAHGAWTTHDNSGLVTISEFDEHGLGLFAARIVELEELDSALARLRKFLTKALVTIRSERDRRKKAQPQEQPPQSPSP